MQILDVLRQDLRLAARSLLRAPAFTLGVSLLTGVVVGLAPLMHTRVKGLAAAWKEGGERGAIGAARHHVRRGLVMAEVALAVMLVIGAGLLIRYAGPLTESVLG